ncbi:MAG: hypothetical protein Q9226_005335 [Calogaya cf. arnoldii]
MRLPPKSTVDDASEASDESNETSSLSEATSPLESALTINVDSTDTHEHSTKRNLADLLQAQFSHLDLTRRSNGGLNTPSTARDLYDASPRASPSPEPREREEQSTLDTTPIESHEDQFTSPIVTALRHLNTGHGPETYNVKDEALPVMPVFDKKFQSCLKSGKAIADSIHANLNTCSLAEGDSELGRLRAAAGRLRSFESPATRLIGIVGDSAAGKSSLINSLLDIPDLAHKGDHGSAVTSFVTEYHRRSSQQTAPFTIEVEYCNETEIDEQLYELLVSYRELYQPGLEKELENNESLYREIETKSTVAASTLQSIFPNRPEVAPRQLKDQGKGVFERILRDLKRLASFIEWPSDAVNGRWTATATSSSECHEKVAYFMEKGLWPLTNIVRIYLSAQVLKTGVILADLPGYRDINLARDIDLPAAERKYKRVVTSKAGNKALRARRDAWGPSGSAAAAQRADTEYKYLFVSARNTDVERALRTRYLSLAPGLSVNVFCVGNRDYEGAEYRSQEAHLRAIQGSGIPDLRRFCHSVVAHAQYDASLHFLEVELASLLQSLQVWLSVSEQKDRVSVDPQIVTDLQGRLAEKIDDFAEELEDAVKLEILDSMSNILQRQGFRYNPLIFDRAKDLLTNVLSGDSYKAFCRQNGDYCTPAVGARDWNSELQGSMTDVMRNQWLGISTALEALDRGLQTSVAKDCKDMRDELKGERAHIISPLFSHGSRHDNYLAFPTNKHQAQGAPATIVASFRLKERELVYRLREVCFETRREAQTIEFNAFGTHISSFILDLMIPTYRSCAAQTGTGTMKRMHGIMRTRLERRDLFALMSRSIEEETRELFGERFDVVRELVGGMGGEIRGQLETFNGPEREVQKRNPRMVERVRACTEIAKERETMMRRALDDFKKSLSG